MATCSHSQQQKCLPPHSFQWGERAPAFEEMQCDVMLWPRSTQAADQNSRVDVDKRSLGDQHASGTEKAASPLLFNVHRELLLDALLPPSGWWRGWGSQRYTSGQFTMTPGSVLMGPKLSNCDAPLSPSALVLHVHVSTVTWSIMNMHCKVRLSD